MDFGNAVQDSIEIIYSFYDYQFGNGWEAEKHRLPEVEKYFLKQWTIHNVPEDTFKKYMKTKAGRESGYTKREQLYEEFKNDGLAILRSYWKEKELLIVEHGIDIDQTEVKLWVDMHNPVDPSDKLPIPLSGRIDYVTRQTETVKRKLGDFKTSKGSLNAKDMVKKIQCKAYPFGWLMLHGEFLADFDYVVLRKGLVSEDRIQVVPLHFDESDMLEFYIRVKSILLRIANREFPRGQIGHQSFCDCYKYEELLKV